MRDEARNVKVVTLTWHQSSL